MTNELIDFHTRKIVFEKRRKIKELISMLDDDCQILMGKMSHGMNEYVSTSISSMNDIFEMVVVSKNNLTLDHDENKITGVVAVDSQFSEISSIFENIPFMMNIYIKKENTENVKIHLNSVAEVKMSDISRIEIDKSAYLKDL